MKVPANSGLVMEFYWRNPGGENVSFLFFLHSSPVLTFPKLLLFPDEFLFSLSVVVANTGLLMAEIDAWDTCDKLNGTTAKWFQTNQISKKLCGTTQCWQVVSSRLIVLFSPGRSFSID